jgi:single-strand DNA-binding protein
MDSFITITGNLTREPEIRFNDQGMQITKFAVATTRKLKSGDEQTSFYDVVSFGRTAENIANSLNKGSRVLVSGRLEVRNYEKQDGTRGTAVEVVAEEVGASLRFAQVGITRNEKVGAGAPAGGSTSNEHDYSSF